jgi:uncharacterized membrane protein
MRKRNSAIVRTAVADLLILLVFAIGAWTASAATGATPGSPTKAFEWTAFLAPFHSVVLHLPIGFLTLAFILEIYRNRRPSDELKRVVTLVMWLCLLSGIVTVAFGLLRARGGDYEARTVELHRWFGISVLAGTVLTLLLQRLTFRGTTGGAQFAYQASLLFTLSLIAITGHFGGNLTHGSGYLLENAPAFVRAWFGPIPSAHLSAPSSNLTEPQQFYVAKVEPILRTKCYACHGPEKQKGHLRLDQPDLALKGGSSGTPAIKPGDVFGSNLARLILLPPDHDDVMPPSGKEPLKPEELAIIIQWIRTGAAFPHTNTTATASN